MAKTAKSAEKPEPVSVEDTICARIADGDSLRSICSDEGMPDKATVFRWLAEDDAFATKYARAREAQAEHHHDEMDRIEGAVESGAINPQAASVILTNKRWRMEKLKPKVYGAAVTVKGDPDNPLETRASMSEAALEALAATGLKRG